VRPPWLDTRAYPFATRALEIEGARVHYVDEGQGPTVLFVHGLPTWSFLYRHLVRGLRDRWRCVVPDMLGFGLSDKPANVSYRPEDQARRLGQVIDALGLDGFTLVVHDFGGPIGLAQAIEGPERVQRLVLFNTWMWSLAGERRYAWMGRLVGSALGRVLYERLGFSARVVWKSAIARRDRYTAGVHRHYVAPLATAAERRATWEYARALLGSSAWYDGLWQRRDRIRDVPALLAWGMKDPAFAGALPRWRTVFRTADVLELADVGHAPPEEHGPELAARIADFLSRPASLRARSRS
jgi:haloalkane dehalogenase